MVVGGRQAVTILTKASWVCGGLFLFFSLILSVLQTHRGVSTTEVQDLLRQQQAAPTQAAPLPLDTAATPAGGQTTPQPAPSGN